MLGPYYDDSNYLEGRIGCSKILGSSSDLGQTLGEYGSYVFVFYGEWQVIIWKRFG